MPSLFLRVFAECPSLEASTHVAAQLVAMLEPLCPIERLEVAPYTKFDDYFGITVWFGPSDGAQHAYDDLLQRVSTGWTFTDDLPNRDSVWNQKDSAVFLHPSVRWANLVYDAVG